MSERFWDRIASRRKFLGGATKVTLAVITLGAGGALVGCGKPTPETPKCETPDASQTIESITGKDATWFFDRRSAAGFDFKNGNELFNVEEFKGKDTVILLAGTPFYPSPSQTAFDAILEARGQKDFEFVFAHSGPDMNDDKDGTDMTDRLTERIKGVTGEKPLLFYQVENPCQKVGIIDTPGYPIPLIISVDKGGKIIAYIRADYVTPAEILNSLGKAS